MWNIISKTLLIIVIIVSFTIYVSRYSNWPTGGAMLAGQLLMIVVYEIFGPYVRSLLNEMDNHRESK